MTDHSATSRSAIPFLAVCTTFVIAACAPGGGAGSAAPTAADTAAIAAVGSAWADAYNKKDIAGLTALYITDAVQLMSNGKLLKGASTITSTIAADTAHWGHLVITNNPPPVIAGDLAYGTGTSVVHIPGPGGKTDTLPGAYIVTLRKDAGTWKIAALADAPDSAAVAAMMAAMPKAPPAKGKAK